MAIPRQVMPEQDAVERRSNFNEVNLGFDEETAMLEAIRCIECKKPVCIDGCPVNIDIPKFISKISDGDFFGAIDIIKEDNLLPAVCGRVCPQEVQCELTCILGKKYKPVSIGRLERFAADYDMAHRNFEMPKVLPKNGKKVALLGSGPASLTCASDLIKWGYDVTIYEALHELGGVLVYGIPEFRLPKALLKKEIGNLEKIGVKFVKNFIVGKTLTVDELLNKEGYDAIFIGAGAGLPWFMNIPGENLNGIYSANEYLTRVNLMKAYDFPNADTPIKRAKKVVVVGGGNVAMDSVRTAKRLGAERAIVLYRRTEKEMPARDEEIQHAKEEGIEFHLLTAPIEYIGDDDGWVKQAKCIRMELGEPDASGRRRPISIEGSEFLFDIDLGVVAIGNGSNPLISQTIPDLKCNKWGNIIADLKTGRTSKKGVFAGGDIVRGSATVILAMGDGRVAAKSIDKYLKTGV
ncbi:MAG: NADPH-dependent glutamate synthase [Bacteroidetes bacterium]|nr:NADPH-dependent glutamate synthase [Bacteroidota bacterium]